MLIIALRLFSDCYHGNHLRTNIDHLIVSGFWFRIKELVSLGYPSPQPLVIECMLLVSMLLNSLLCTSFFVDKFCIAYFFKQSTGNCSRDLRRSLVNYLHGKGILTSFQTRVLGSMFGRYFQEKLLQIYPEVLSNLLRSMVNFLAL